MHVGLRYFDLIGPVREVSIRRKAGLSDAWTAEVIQFDSEGRLTWRARTTEPAAPRAEWKRRTSAAVRVDGSVIEEEPVAGVDTWHGRYVPNVEFGCKGAVFASTLIEPSGVPIETVFQDPAGAPLSRVRYAADADGCITSARQDLEDMPPALRSQVVFCLVSMSYDGRRRVSKQSIVMLGEEVMSYAWEYSREGDVTLSRVCRDHTLSPGRHAYEDVDRHGNWTTHVAVYDEQHIEERRTIQYRA
jgi:hypothetical protein